MAPVKNFCVSSSFLFIFFIFIANCLCSSTVYAQPAESPAPPPANDGVTIDLGIAYALLLTALVVTYLVHPMDALAFKFF
ncbi:hypothetical protein KP509_21G041400 [Ceratopteris richardii]|uniref:Uncharacterized protein n=1 Tax=Ceratopteris richardii TaxID=49495 RepID=A0A8T2S995_CERRI|nr:hypothetical protein KP509_21G041400 [Ceratopteris richardii]